MTEQMHGSKAVYSAPAAEVELMELRVMVQTIAEAVRILATSMERLPTEQPDETERKLARGVREAHELLLTVPAPRHS